MVESITGLIAPVYTCDLDLAAPLPELNGIRYRGARLLARLHGWPVGEAFIPLPRRRVNAADLAALVWPLVADGAAKHCAGDGIQLYEKSCYVVMCRLPYSLH